MIPRNLTPPRSSRRGFVVPDVSALTHDELVRVVKSIRRTLYEDPERPGAWTYDLCDPEIVDVGQVVCNIDTALARAGISIEVSPAGAFRRACHDVRLEMRDHVNDEPGEPGPSFLYVDKRAVDAVDPWDLREDPIMARRGAGLARFVYDRIGRSNAARWREHLRAGYPAAGSLPGGKP